MLFVVGSTQELCAKAIISQDDVVEFKTALDLAKAGPEALRGELTLKGHPNRQVSVLFESLDLSAVASGKLVAVPPGVAPGMRGTVRIPCGRRSARLFGVPTGDGSSEPAYSRPTSPF